MKFDAKLALILSTLLACLLFNVTTFAKDFKVCGYRDQEQAGLVLQREADIYCGHKEKRAVSTTEVFDDKPKAVWVRDAWGRMFLVQTACYKQDFECVRN